jgi:hypothetical protein
MWGPASAGPADYRSCSSVRALRLADVIRPPLVVFDGVDAEADDFRVALVELGFESGHARYHTGRVTCGSYTAADPTLPLRGAEISMSFR